MSNQLRIQFFIMKKNKMWLFIILLSIFFISIFTLATYSLIKQASTAGISGINKLNEFIDSDMSLVDFWENIICSDAITMFTAIFAVVFSMIEFQTGFIKNMWLTLKNQNHFLIGKYFITAVHIIVSFVISILVVTIWNALVLHSNSVGNISSFIKVVAVQFLLQISFCSIVICFSLLVRKNVVAVVVSIIYIMLAKSGIYKVLDMIIESFPNVDESFSIGKYLPYGNIFAITTESNGGDFIRAIIVAICFFLISSIISITMIKRKDIC